MKHKKSLLAAIALGAFASVNLALASNTYATQEFPIEGVEEEEIEIDCSTNSYKILKDYDTSHFVQYKITEGCTSALTFDLNGKKIEDGQIFNNNRNLTITDSVGNGYFKNMRRHVDPNATATRNDNAEFSDNKFLHAGGTYGDNSVVTTIEKGIFAGNMIAANVTINGGTFSDGVWDHVVGSTVLRLNSGAFNNISIGSYGAPSTYISSGEYSNFSILTNKDTVLISGGTFSEKPDEKYLFSGYTTYEVDGKYIVDRSFMLTNFFQYMYVGQTNEAYISPAIISKTTKVTSSDESILGISCKDSTKLLGQMMVESEDIISKACTITAKKAGKAVLSYTTDYGYKGDITVHVADIDATSYGDNADSAKHELTARYLSVYIADPVEHTWYTTAPSAVDASYGTYLDNLKKQFAGLVSVIDAGHKIKLDLNIGNSTLSEEEKALLDGKNIATVYTVSGSITDATDKKTVVEDWRSDISSLPLPQILENRNRAVQIASFSKDSVSTEIRVNLIDAEVKGNSVDIINAIPGAIHSLWASYYKFAILYDGEPIQNSSANSGTNTIPSVPDTGSQSESVAIILGASAAILLTVIAPLSYVIYRKKSLSRVHF